MYEFNYKPKYIYEFLKRCADIVGSTLGIIVFFIPMLIIALIIKCSSEGPVIFKDKRVDGFYAQ